jgi:predicted phosphodiesterase
MNGTCIMTWKNTLQAIVALSLVVMRSCAWIAGPTTCTVTQCRRSAVLLKSASSNSTASAQVQVQVRRLDGIDRVFCLSDLHTDHVDNMKWLSRKLSHSKLTPSKDLIIVAGDISHDMETLRQSMKLLLQKAQVLFVPGNHEAWVDRRSSDDHDKHHHHRHHHDHDHHHPTSFDKLRQVYQTCQEMGVHTQPLLIGATSPHPLWIIPLESWYDGTLSFRESLCHDFDAWPWADFKRCVWENPNFPPDPSLGVNRGQLPVGLVEYFLHKNRPLLQHNPLDDLLLLEPNNASNHLSSTGIMTVSHFLPNVQTLPDWKDLDSPIFKDEWFNHGAGGMSAKFAKVAGSWLLDEQIRQLLVPASPATIPRHHVHIFGHSHRPKDLVHNGIRYIHNPLGKPRERQLYMVSPQVDFQLVWDTQTTGQIPGETVIRYWEEKGGGVEALGRRLQQIKPRGRYNRYPGSAFPKEQQGQMTNATMTTIIMPEEPESSRWRFRSRLRRIGSGLRQIFTREIAEP